MRVRSRQGQLDGWRAPGKGSSEVVIVVAGHQSSHKTQETERTKGCRRERQIGGEQDGVEEPTRGKRRLHRRHGPLKQRDLSSASEKSTDDQRHFAL